MGTLVKDTELLEQIMTYSSTMYDGHNLLHKDITRKEYYSSLIPALNKVNCFTDAKEIVDKYIKDNVFTKN